VTASTGNHGAATAWAAKRTGVRAVVFVPQQASAAKVALIQTQGAELYRVGADMDEAKAAARAYAAEHDAFFFEDGAEPAQFDGYEAIGHELLDELPEPAPSSCRSGTARWRSACCGRSPSAHRLRSASPSRRRRRPRCGRAGRPVSPTDSDRCSTFADGLAVRVAIPLAVAELNPLVQQFELVSEAELEDAMRAYAEAGIRVEGAAAAPLALARREWLPRPLVLIVTGRNVDDALYNRILTSEP